MSANKETKSNELPERDANFPVKKDGLDEWNDRLDENLETEKDSDPLADEKSKDFFEKNEKLK
ncbi:hypothetical protein ABIB40_001853 [Pedobacter sp. UYP30]|uniref:hypothetical protein n=1 Tax=Pedobacter sp. UYP30 TaxID=1756400 RepID=UPI003398D340